MTNHPYTDAAPWRLWRQAVAAPPPGEVDPVIAFPFRMTPSSRIVTAGSCFAQHIARHLGEHGFNHFIAEPAHPLLDKATAAAFNYGIYSARYGNIYTARQFLQLLQRAHGIFLPQEDVWPDSGRFYDPFRPLIQPDGFSSRAEFDADRGQHFAAVRHAFAEADYVIFTLGLTECWESVADGAVFPLCPGTVHGTFDPLRHRLHNLTVDETVEDLRACIAFLRAITPAARVILTVSPVPLAATAEAQHVLSATTYSKSVLRVAAEMVCQRETAVYFPSYEIITGLHARGRYFAEDCRSVTEAGVAHVMRCFLRHATSLPGDPDKHANAATVDSGFDVGRDVVQAICEEESLDSH